MKLKTTPNGNTSLLNLIIIALVGVAAYMLYSRGKLDGYLPEQYRHATRAAAATSEDSEQAGNANAPATAASASPATTAQSAPPAAPATAPASSSSAPAAAAATPAGATLAQLAAIPRQQWPKQIAILQELEIPIISGGRVAGSMKAKPGTLFELVDISGNNVSIRTGGQVRSLPASHTDAAARFQQIAIGR